MGNNGSKDDGKALNVLLEKLYRDGGYDFRDYKRGTITRRLNRRLYATGTTNYQKYSDFLESHPEEYQNLANDLTIKVSGFFRSQNTFQQVARLVLPPLVTHKIRRGERSLNLWSAACARGEEPYSMAILLAEFLGSQLSEFEISIHASDINRQALAEAEAGIYSPKELESLPPPMLANHFRRNGKGYVVNSKIRQMVRFAYFDLTSTASPHSASIDCVFCCNILIYLQRQLQEKVLNLVYDSLATPGYLVLGEVETPTDNLRPKLKCINVKAKIFRKG
jgi:chemotaxis methyl-accepting protein methylase